MQTRKLARCLAWVLGVCAALIVIPYAVLFAINWSDEAPSKDALALASTVESRRDVPDAANAWVFNLGLAAPQGQDPFALGKKRKVFLERYKAPPEGREADRLPGPEIQYKRDRPPAIAAIAEACLTGDAACVRLVHGDFGQVERWLASEAWLLQRFERMEALREWKEVVPKDHTAPIGLLHHAINGQQLLLMQAWKLARSGDGEGARAMIDRDFTFWRMVLRSADTLMAKTIASAALERNLSVGNLVLRDLHAAGRPAEPPPSWRLSLTQEERSMRRVFAAEYIPWQAMFAALVDKPDLVSRNRLKDVLARPFFKPQATSNLMARDIVRLSDRMDVAMDAMPAAAETMHQDAWDGQPHYHAYNLFGSIMYDIAGADYMGTYALRVSDVEGVRRAALLAADLRENAASESEIDERMRSSRWIDPYTQAPFVRDAKAASILFTGLARAAPHQVLL